MKQHENSPKSSPAARVKSPASLEIFAAVEGDFYKIDPMLFSPACVSISNMDTGSTSTAAR